MRRHGVLYSSHTNSRSCTDLFIFSLLCLPQVRDFQSKALTTVFMVMSGWAGNPDKQPWTWGEPFTTYNRATLKLKAQLTPYIYSYCRGAYDTGVPPVRALLLEFPADEHLYTPSVGTSYSYMSGEYLLAAPVYTLGAVTRDGIYLPAGAQWVDWWTGGLYAGNQTLDGYDAPLSILPLFVRAGAIVPLWPPMNYPGEVAADPMYLELWPAGNTSFELYEDDGLTRAALPPTSAFGRTAINVTAPPAYLNSSAAAGNVTITVGAVAGTYTGQLAARGWWLNVRCRAAPLLVVLTNGSGAIVLPQMQSEAQLEYSVSGWFHDPLQQRGLLMVKTPSMTAAVGFSVTLSSGPSYPHIGTETCDTPDHHQVENQKFVYNASTGKIAVVEGGSVSTTCITVGADKDPDSRTPALELQTCSSALNAAQQFVVVPASNQLALKADASTCLDQDVTDHRIITYSCHDASSPGNQAWSLNPDDASQHIVSRQNGLCMCVLGA